jgi:hypothetical protein
MTLIDTCSTNNENTTACLELTTTDYASTLPKKTQATLSIMKHKIWHDHHSKLCAQHIKCKPLKSFNGRNTDVSLDVLKDRLTQLQMFINNKINTTDVEDL